MEVEWLVSGETARRQNGGAGILGNHPLQLTVNRILINSQYSGGCGQGGRGVLAMRGVKQGIGEGALRVQSDFNKDISTTIL